MTALRVFLKSGLHNLRSLWVGHDVAQTAVVDVAQRLWPWPSTSAQLFLIAAFYVSCQADDIVSGSSAFDAHKQPGVVGSKLSGRRSDGGDNAILEEPAHPAFVNRISIQAVNIPTENATSFATLNAVEHLIEHRSAGKFSASALLKCFKNWNVFAFGERAKFVRLGIKAHHLTILFIRALASIKEKSCRLHNGSIADIRERSSIKYTIRRVLAMLWLKEQNAFRPSRGNYTLECMNPWMIYPTWQNFSSLFREVTTAGEENSDFLRFHHLTSSLYYAITFVEALLNEKHRGLLESAGRPEEEIVFILRRGSSASNPKKGRDFEAKFSEWPSLICDKEIRVSPELKKTLTDFNEVRGHLTHPKTRGHDVYGDLENIKGQQLLEAVAEYAITLHNGLGEEYPYWLFGWNYIGTNKGTYDPSRINNQQFLHSLDYFGLNVSAYDAQAVHVWRGAMMTNFNGYKEISHFLASCRECEPFDPQFPLRPRLVKRWWDSTFFEKNKDFIRQRPLPIGYGTVMISPMIISPIEIVAKPKSGEKSS